ncbi:MAG: RNA helicase, partial [Myxococcales bacterium]
PKGFSGRNPQHRRDLANTLKHKTHGLQLTPGHTSGVRGGAHDDPEVARLRQQLKEHPCHACPDREEHARWGERWFKLHRDAQTLRRRIEQRTNTIARHFDRICDVLTSLDYLDGDDVSPRGQGLMRIYNDSDLVAAEALRLGLWDDLSPSQLASVLSALVFESRRTDGDSPRIPGGKIHEVLNEQVRLTNQLVLLERDHKLDQLRDPDLGFCFAALRWAEGDELDDVLDLTGMAAGDFVRTVKQLIDFTEQVASAAGNSSLRTTARSAAESMRRGVVSYTSVAD